MASYEVSLVIDGIEGAVETHRNEGAAYAAADQLADEAKDAYGDSIAWHVYVTPIVATYSNEDEVFVPHAPDHKPYRSGS